MSRRYSPSGTQSRRQYSRVFYVKRGSVSVQVYKKAFLSMHGVSNGRLDRALKAQEAAGGTLHCDQRGRHKPGNKTKPDTVDSVVAHINSFPRYKSHYSRKDNPHRQFLNPYIQKMYQLYKEKCERENVQAASEWIYRKVFNEKFNLSFGRYVLLHASLVPRPFPPPVFHRFQYEIWRGKVWEIWSCAMMSGRQMVDTREAVTNR